MNKQKVLRFEVIEDNGGGLHLYIFDHNGRVTHAFHNWEYQKPGCLAENVAFLRAGGQVDAWDNNDPHPQADYDTLTSYPYGYQIVADHAGTYPARMGRAAMLGFNVEQE